MGRDSWQLKMLWISSSCAEPSRIWHELINHSEINQAFTRAAIIEKIKQTRRCKSIHFNRLRQRYEIVTEDLD